MSDRIELLKNAIAFLSDSKVCKIAIKHSQLTRISHLQAREASYTQKIQFLESKGLTNAEIDEALRQTTATPSNIYPRSSVPSSGLTPSIYGLPQSAPTRELDWRDFFVR